MSVLWQGVFNDQITDPGISASEHFRMSNYGFFSFWHLFFVLLLFVILAVCFVAFFRRKNIEKIVLVTTTIIANGCMLALVIIAVVTGVYNIEWFLPFHICNLLGIVMLVSCFSKRFKKFFLDYTVWMGIGGSIVAIVFAITSMGFIGVFHIASILVWVHHVAIGAIGMYYVASGHYRKINVWPILGTWGFLLACAALVNHLTGSNFMFINSNRMMQPMTGVTYAFGRFGVWVVFGLCAAIFVAIQLVFNWFAKRKHLTLREFTMQNWFVQKVVKSKLLMGIIADIKSGVSKTANNIIKTTQNKTAKKAISLTERFINCIKKSDILNRIFDSQLGDLTSCDYLTETFENSELLKILDEEFSLNELKQLEELPSFDTYLLPSSQAGRLLLN